MVRIYSILRKEEERREAEGWSEMARSIEKTALNSIRKMISVYLIPYLGTDGGASSIDEKYMNEMKKFQRNLNGKIDAMQRWAEEFPYERQRVSDIAWELRKIIRAFEQGGSNNFYCRGVGRIIYPEVSGVFRGNRKYEEDRLYREMVASFPEEFHGLKYLDRLAKMQHYELPTRMLDITSNPLVALYMACNKIYTGDPEQLDDGEVILYFNQSIKNRSYDSKTMLIVAALVKLTYEDKATMYAFLTMLEQYLSNRRSASDGRKIRKCVNICVHIAAERGINAKFRQENKDDLEAILEQEDVGNTPMKCCWGLLNGIRRPRKPDGWRRLKTTPNRYEEDYDYELAEADFKQMFERFVQAYKKLLFIVRREEASFENKINVFMLLKSYPGQFGMSNPRIQAQAGGFILGGLDQNYINDEMLSTRSKLEDIRFPRIIITDKKEVYRQLQMLNITDATLLPDLTHKAHVLDRQIR